MTILKRLGRRRLRGAVALAAAAILVGSLTSAVSASPQAASFDLDSGNALTQVIYPMLNTPEPRAEYYSRPGSWVVDHAMLIEMPWFDAIAPYHPTAVGIFSDLGRRPAEERTTRNKNIAVIYSAFTSLNALFPQHRSSWVRMMELAGLDANNTAEDPTTPSGIGIIAAKTALAVRRNDGSNRYGDEGGRRYNRQPYADYTGYQPVNTAYQLRNPSRWQPNVTTKRDVSTVQEFATPQFGRVTPISIGSPDQFPVAPPPNNYHLDNWGYRQQAAEILTASASLDDRRKVSAEIFDDPLRPYGPVAHTILDGYGYDVERSVHFTVTTDVASLDTAIVSWYYMRRYDSVRPFSAIRQLYGEKKVTAWGGPGKGTVSDITGDEWRSYVSPITTASPGYPSVNAAVCLTYAQVARRFTGSDALEIYMRAPKGSSLVEPGTTPATDLTLHWSSYTDWAAECGQSRVWAGENFPASVRAANRYAPRIGDTAYEFIQGKLAGR